MYSGYLLHKFLWIIGETLPNVAASISTKSLLSHHFEQFDKRNFSSSGEEMPSTREYNVLRDLSENGTICFIDKNEKKLNITFFRF